jgi:hypothetical protein
MKRLLLLLVPAALVAQDTTVKIQGNGPRNSPASVSIVHKSSLVTYALGNGTIDGAGIVSLPISINSRTGQLPAALQFDLRWTAAEVVSVTFSTGPAAVAAVKTIQCAAQPATGAQRCVISGLNANPITDGVVAFANITTSLTSQATTTLALFGTVSASIAAGAIPTAIAPGGGVVAMPALLATVTCAQPDIWTGATVGCTVALNKPAPSGGSIVALSSDSALVSTPASIAIAAGATSAPFTITGN